MQSLHSWERGCDRVCSHSDPPPPLPGRTPPLPRLCPRRPCQDCGLRPNQGLPAQNRGSPTGTAVAGPPVGPTGCSHSSERAHKGKTRGSLAAICSRGGPGKLRHKGGGSTGKGWRAGGWSAPLLSLTMCLILLNLEVHPQLHLGVGLQCQGTHSEANPAPPSCHFPQRGSPTSPSTSHCGSPPATRQTSGCPYLGPDQLHS